MSVQALSWALDIEGVETGPRFVLVVLANRADEDGRCFPSVRAIVRQTAMDERTVRRHIATLIERGYLSRTTRARANGSQTSNEYELAVGRSVGARGAGNTPGAGTMPGGGGHHAPPGEGTMPPLESKDESKEEPLLGDSIARRTAKPEKQTDPEFEEAWRLYPRRAGGNPKHDARKSWNARRREGVPAEVMVAGVARYAKFCQREGKLNTEYVMQARRFFGPGRPFEEPYAAEAASAPAAAPVVEQCIHIDDAGKRCCEPVLLRIGLARVGDRSVPLTVCRRHYREPEQDDRGELVSHPETVAMVRRFVAFSEKAAA